MFGSSKSSGVGGETLTGFVWSKIKDRVQDFLAGAAATQLGKIKNLFKPKAPASPASATPGSRSLPAKTFREDDRII